MATSPAPTGGTLKRDKGWMGTLTRRSRKAEKEGEMTFNLQPRFPLSMTIALLYNLCLGHNFCSPFLYSSM